MGLMICETKLSLTFDPEKIEKADIEDIINEHMEKLAAELESLKLGLAGNHSIEYDEFE